MTSSIFPPKTLLEMQNPRPHPRSAGSERAFQEDSQVVHRHIKFKKHWSGLVQKKHCEILNKYTYKPRC